MASTFILDCNVHVFVDSQATQLRPHVLGGMSAGCRSHISGTDARFLHTNTAVHGDLGMIGKNDIVYLLSKGGNTHETVALADHLRTRGTNTWLMTFTENCKEQ